MEGWKEGGSGREKGREGKREGEGEGEGEGGKEGGREGGGRREEIRKKASYLFRYGLFTPAIFGVSHLMYRTHAHRNPNTATIKHILAELVRFSFRRLVIYAPGKRNYLAVSNLSRALAQ